MALKDQSAADHRAAIETRGNLLAAAVLQVFLRTDFGALSQTDKDSFEAIAQNIENDLSDLMAWGDAQGVSSSGSGACKATP